MVRDRADSRNNRHLNINILALIVTLVLLACMAWDTQLTARADEPYAPSRDYDLQDIRTHLWFDGASRQFRGEVTERVAALRAGVVDLKFDSVGLNIQDVTVDGAPSKFSTTAAQLIVSLARPTTRGDRHEILIRYSGQPKRGLYFILPIKIIRTNPRKFGPKAKRRTLATTFPFTIIRMIAPPPKCC